MPQLRKIVSLALVAAAATACGDDGPDRQFFRAASPTPGWSVDREDWTDSFEMTPWTAAGYAATDMRFLPDGRALLITKGGWQGPGTGQVILLSGDGQTAQDLLEIPVCTDAERGLLGIELDPDFTRNQTIYLFYTRQMSDCATEGAPETPTTPVYNRLSAFRFDEHGIDPTSERIILDELPGHQSSHNAGGLAFLSDGTLLVAVGEASYRRSRDLDFVAGKILRLDPRNGAALAPPDNPHYDPSAPDSVRSLVYASGLRNPFRIAVDPLTGQVAAAEVGTDEYEEINLIDPGADYGFPDVEGPESIDGVTSPAMWYTHDGVCNSVIGGAWVPAGWLPGTTRPGYAFTDFGCGGVFLTYFDGDTATRLAVIGGLIGHSVASVILGPDNALYLVGIGPGPFPVLRLARNS